MSGRQRRVLMVGTDPAGRGGIAAVVKVLADAGLFERARVRYVASHGAGGAPAKLWRLAAAAVTLLRLCWRRPAPIVHVHAASRASFYRKSLLLLLARACGCPTVLHLHGGAFEQFAVHESSACQQWWIRYTLTHSSRVLALSAHWRDFLARYVPQARVAVLANAVVLPDLTAAPPAQPGTILFLGRIEAAKGVFDLLDALALLAPARPALRLLVGGEGDSAALLAHAAAQGLAQRVQLLGWLDPGARAAALARAQCFCLPSHDEGLPMAMLEAMAAGKAVVATAVGGIPDVIDSGANGLLVPPRAPAALAAALARLLDDAPACQAMGAAARRTVAARFGAGQMVAALASLYQQL